MNSSLAVIPEEQSHRAPLGPVASAIRLVNGTDTDAQDNANPVLETGPDSAKSLADPATPFAAAETVSTAPVASVASLKPLSPDVADLEHWTSQLDAEKVAIIPAGVTINCDLITDGVASIIIGGTVHGIVDAGTAMVIVRESGVVNGCVKSEESVVIAGSVTSADPKGMAIVTSGLWVLADTARVRGDVAYARHRAYEGSVFSGRAVPFSEYTQ